MQNWDTAFEGNVDLSRIYLIVAYPREHLIQKSYGHNNVCNKFNKRKYEGIAFVFITTYLNLSQCSSGKMDFVSYTHDYD